MSPVLSLTTSKLLLAVLRYNKSGRHSNRDAYRMDWYRQDHSPNYDNDAVAELASVAVLGDN